jgi:mono/diheme cytochrome c family protein
VEGIEAGNAGKGAEAEGGEQLRGGGGEKLRWSAMKGTQPRRGDAWETMGAVSARLISGVVSFVDYA